MYPDINKMTKRVEDAVVSTEHILVPVRQSLFKRFPILLTCLVTFGIVATFYGMERIIIGIPWLNERPILILMAGLATLIFTGKLYQKLG